MKIDAKDANGYVAAVDPVRRPHLERVRALVKETVPQATEAILHGMLGYSCDGRLFASLGAQKNYLSLYLCDLSTQPELRATHGEALARLKMGKSCINFTSTDDCRSTPSRRSSPRRHTSRGARWR